MASGRIKVVVCPTCQRRRRCRVVSEPDTWDWRCSQGHVWAAKKTSWERASDLIRHIYEPILLDSLRTSSDFMQIVHRRMS